MFSRPRDTVLQGLELFRDVYPSAQLNHVLAFLYVAENEGLSITELSTVVGGSIATSSRAVRAMYQAKQAGALWPAVGLVEADKNLSIPNGRLLQLTRRGRELRDRIDRTIRAAVTIQPDS